MINSKAVKAIRKWAKLRKLDYRACKKLYHMQTLENRIKMIKEVNEYIAAVEGGFIIPGPPIKDDKVVN